MWQCSVPVSVSPSPLSDFMRQDHSSPGKPVFLLFYFHPLSSPRPIFSPLPSAISWQCGLFEMWPHRTPSLDCYVTLLLLRACYPPDRPYCLVVSLPDSKPRGPGFGFRPCQIFWVTVDLERGPLSPCGDKWGATWKKSSRSGLENWD
jgi:hypothetical protein